MLSRSTSNSFSEDESSREIRKNSQTLALKCHFKSTEPYITDGDFICVPDYLRPGVHLFIGTEGAFTDTTSPVEGQSIEGGYYTEISSILVSIDWCRHQYNLYKQFMEVIEKRDYSTSGEK